MGRVRRVAGIESTNQMQRRASERIAINTPVQGSAADIIKRAMIAIQGRLSRELPEVKMVMQVHDELVFEVPESLTGDATTLVIGEMEQAWEMKVPLVVNAATGRNWLEAH